MSRVHNFSAGPGVLPLSVVEETREAIRELEGCGEGLMETSHRGKAFDAVVVRARERLRRLLKLSDDQEVLFLHGGARTQFFQVPMNLLRGGRAAYHDTGTWSDGAITEAQRYGSVDVLWSSRERGYDSVPQPGEARLVAAGTRYLHYTSNNTIAGSEYRHVPAHGDAWLVCDASSNILSRPIDGSAFDILYAGAQKNLGPSGTTLVVLRKGLLESCDPDLPAMCRYPLHVKKQSMYNTPCTTAIYVVERVAAWLEEQGLDVVDARNQAQSERIYGMIDRSGFWRGLVQPASRSRMNITFTTGSAERDARFVSQAHEAGLHGLKGHRSVGGLRASVYNAQTDEAVDALVDFMKDFEAREG